MVPGRFTATDEVFYKAAGRNWAMTGHFAAPEIVGRLAKGPSLADVYFAQPPPYTFFFGVYTKLAGFGPRQCIFYDVLIHLLLVWTAVVAARIVFKLSWMASLFCGALFFPLGTVGRSDELAIVFALWAAVAFRAAIPKRWSVVIGGVFLGLVCATSLSAFVFLGPVVVWEFLGGSGRGTRSVGHVRCADIGESSDGVPADHRARRRTIGHAEFHGRKRLEGRGRIHRSVGQFPTVRLRVCDFGVRPADIRRNVPVI
jgi:hypothetical protein